MADQLPSSPSHERQGHRQRARCGMSQGCQQDTVSTVALVPLVLSPSSSGVGLGQEQRWFCV